MGFLMVCLVLSPAERMEGVSRSPLGCTTETLSPASFVKWCSNHKVLWEQCKIAVSDVTGRCVVAKQHIRQGEVVVEVPDSQVLMAENSQINELLADCGLSKPADDALLEVQGLILAVMYEKALGKKSHWEPYLSFLPTDMSHMIVYWTDAELSELRGTAAYDKLIGRVQHPADAPTRMRQLFEELVLPFVQSHESVCKTLLGKKPDKCSEEEAREKLWPLYQWSTSVVASYSFVLGDDQYQGMVPVWDLLNHITGQVNVRLHHDADREVLQMVATADIPAGAEVVNCYGRLSNAELLRGYGFVEQHNMIKHVHVPAQFLIRAAAAAVVDSEAAAAAAGRGDSRKRKRDLAADRDDQEDQAAVPNHQAESSDHDDHDDDQDQDDSDNDDDHDHDESSDEGDDSSSDEDDDSSSDEDDDDEPDWDLEDDSSEDYAIIQQQQQGVSIPRLAAAQSELADWEDRWQLCHFLKLLPKNNVFQVPAGGLAAVQGNLLAVLLLLLADGWACEQLAAAAIAATSQAAEAAAAAPKEKHSKVHKGKKHKKQQQQQQEQYGSAACDAAAAAVAEVAAKASRKLAKQEFDVAPALLLSSLKLLIQLMLSRYNCSLEQDYQQQQDEKRLPPRLAAAVMARIGEKEVLHQLSEELEQGDNADGDQDDVSGQLMTSARQALADALQQVVMSAAAAAASGGGGGCCGVPGCSHEHEKEQQREQQQQRQHADDKRDKVRDKVESGLQSEGKQQQKQKEKKKKQKQPDGGQKCTQKQASSVSTAAESLPQDGRKKKKQKGARHEQQQQQAKKRQAKAFESNGFAFNFQM